MLTEVRLVERVTAAVDRSLEYMARKQGIDGCWGSGYGKNNAVNGLALLAFMGRGHVPGRGPYRDILQRGRTYLLGTAQPSGLLASRNPSQGPMYEHALATLALVEMYGMTSDDPVLEKKVQKAVELIVKVQAANGGWRYQPVPRDADLSVTIMQIVALRAALNADLPVPRTTIERAVSYVKKCAVPRGGFAYQPRGGPSAARTAAGILSLQLCGQADDPAVRKSLDYLNAQPIGWGGQYFYYLHYYAIQAEFQAGGKDWNNWHPKIRELLLRKQNPDGSWDCPPNDPEIRATGKDKIYSTAMATLVLEIYMHFLPAYQR